MNVSRLLVCLLVNITTMLVIGRKPFNLLNLMQCLFLVTYQSKIKQKFISVNVSRLLVCLLVNITMLVIGRKNV